MKDMLTAVVAMAAIILMQIVLSYAFTYQVGELFSRASFVVLFFHYVFKSANNKAKTVK